MKPLALVLLAASASGCATSYTVSRSEAHDVRLLDERLRGHRATMELADGNREDGTVLFLRADSAAWGHALARRAVPTAAVARIVRHRDWGASRRGVLIGAGIGVALGLAVLLGGDSEVYEAEPVAVLMVYGGAAWGLLVGSFAGWERSYVFHP